MANPIAQNDRNYQPGEHPDLKPPLGETGVLKWFRRNLFSSPLSIFLTLLTIWLLWKILPVAINWLFVDAVFKADSRAACREISQGACWGFIDKRLNQFAYGFYPAAERWRVNLFLILIPIALLPLLFEGVRFRRQLFWFSALFPVLAFFLLLGGPVNLAWLLLPLALLPLFFRELPGRGKWLWFTRLYPLIALILIGGGSANLGWLFVLVALGIYLIPVFQAKLPVKPVIAVLLSVAIGCFYLGVKIPGSPADLNLGLEPVTTDQFGGFMLTVVIGLTGIICSLPLGILLALGRQSELAALRTLCVLFIEFIRGVPLITLLFVASTMLNYFLPPGTNFDLLMRVLIMVTLFSAAYIAEVVRGGLQAIPRGQTEAAEAMGLKYWQSMRLIVLPQALKISIPGIVNTFIGLFKDTTLVAIIGLLDPLGIGRASLSDSKWQGLSAEVYVFIALFFFICCFAMARYSLYLEKKLHTGHSED